MRKPRTETRWLRGAVLASLSIPAFFLAPLTQAQQSTSDIRLPESPTNKVIAIGRVTTESIDQLRPHLNQEVRDTVQLYLNGDIEDWYSRKDQPGVVFILNATSVEEAAAKLATLPFVELDMFAFDYVPVGPLQPLGALIAPAAE